MQDVMPPVSADAPLIHSYGAAGFRIGQTHYDGHVLITPQGTYPWNGELTLEALAPILQSQPTPEVLLVGTGARHTMLAPAMRGQLKTQGLGVDTMDTGAACRTFNILLGEGRRVAAALLLPTV